MVAGTRRLQLLFSLLNVLEATCNGDLVDGLLDGVGHQIHPDGGRTVLADAMNACNRLQLNCCIDQRLAEEYVRGIDEVQAR